MSKLIAAAKVNVEAFWPGLFAKALQGRNIGDLICNVGSAPAAGAPASGKLCFYVLIGKLLIIKVEN